MVTRKRAAKRTEHNENTGSARPGPEDILDAAYRLFVTNGYANTHLGEIGEAIGLTRSAIYYYFKDKEEILGRLIERQSARTARISAQLQQETARTAADRLVAMVRLVALNVLKDGDVELLQEGNPVGRHKAQFQKAVQAQRSILDGFRRVTTEGIEEGDFRPVDPTLFAFAVIGMCNWAARWFKEDGRLSPAEAAEMFAEGRSVPGRHPL
jgi:AcrR family transcriptional regulator